MSTMVAPVATIASTMLLRHQVGIEVHAAAGRGRAGDHQQDRAVRVGQHLVVDVGRAGEVAAGEAHLAHRLDDRARVEAGDVDMLDFARQQLRLAGVVDQAFGVLDLVQRVGGHCINTFISRECGLPATRDSQKCKREPRSRARFTSEWNALQRDDVRRALAFRVVGVERRHRLVVDDHAILDPEAVEAGAHRAAIGAEHADLDIVAGLHVGGQHERPGHMVEVVAGRPVEAELHRPRRVDSSSRTSFTG